MVQLSQRLQELLEPTISALGYELVGIEYGSGLLRIYIDQETGIDVKDCEQVSHQVSGLLDVEEPITEPYILEVSSPGLDRPLMAAEHYQRFAGHKIRIQLGVPFNGRRKFTGLLAGMQGGNVILEVDDSTLAIPLTQIDKARLVPEF